MQRIKFANKTHFDCSSFNLLSREFKADPFPFYARLRAEQPVCKVTLPSSPVFAKLG